MRPRYPQTPPPPRRGGRGIAWLALFFSLLACVMSGITLLENWHNGQLLENTQRFVDRMHESLAPRSARTSAPEADRAGEGSGPASDLSGQWDQIRQKLARAEEMIHSHDGRVNEYLAGLKSDMEELSAKSAEKGGAWMDQAAVKLKAIRDQVAVDGPAAARKLRDLSSDLKQQVLTLKRLNDALRPAATPAVSPQGTQP